MSQNDFTIANQGFPAFRADLNSALQALATNNSGTSAPSTTFANQLFYDTTNNILKIRNEDNDAFISLFTLDQANDNIESLTINGAFTCGTFTSTGIDDNADATAITIDSSERVGIGTSSPIATLHTASGSSGRSWSNGVDRVIHEANGTNIMQIVTSTTGTAGVNFADTDARAVSGVQYNHDTKSMAISVNEGSGSIGFFNTSERLRIDSSGNLGLGTSSPSSSFAGARNLVIGGGSGHTGMTILSGTSSRSSIEFSDGTGSDATKTAGGIRYYHDSNYMRFNTNGGTERMRISDAGRVGINNNNPNSAMLHADQTAQNEQGIFIHPEHSSYTNIGLLVQTIRSQTSAFAFIKCKSNSGGDTEFDLRGDGNAYADNAWQGGGADYAEYFEWKDGNTDNEDRRGYTVVLDGNQIRKSTSDDTPSSIIGVVSATPVVVGDNAWNMWNGKYEKDEYGNYILEEHTVTEWKDGNKTKSYHTDKIPSDVTVPDDAVVKTYHVDENGKSTSEKFTRRKESSTYDESKTYIPREERNEWVTIGLVGKLKVNVGQTVGDRWIKMREISDTVHEYLVR
jgi:hypothetical protein